jgi:hypothetical protein
MAILWAGLLGDRDLQGEHAGVALAAMCSVSRVVAGSAAG